LLRSQVEIFEYSPPQIKMAVTGYGRADKAAIGKMVRLQFKLDELGKKAPIIDDTYDAMAVLLTHAGSYGLQQKLQTKN
ncbi:crossover junction endodeoxyribonuclease RuvC, partial [bacterium]|nr:crossover junction endodeoxyribonuclease RuvC [bacterium]